MTDQTNPTMDTKVQEQEQNLINSWMGQKLEILNQLKSNPLAILKVKDDFTKTVDEYLQNLIKNINSEKSDEWFETNTYTHLFKIASSEYFEKLWEIIYMSLFFYDTLYYNFFMEFKIENNDYEWYLKLVKLYKKVYIVSTNWEKLEDENTYSDFTEEFLNKNVWSQEFIEFVSANWFYKKIHFIVHSILKKISLKDDEWFFIKSKEDILYEIYNIFKLDHSHFVKKLKTNIDKFIYIHKHLNETLISVEYCSFTNKILNINWWKLLWELNNKISAYAELNKSGSKKYYFEIYSIIKENDPLNEIDSDLRNRIFDYIAQEIISRFYKNDLAIISTNIKNSIFKKKSIPYKDWSKNSTYFNLSMINKQDSENIIKLKDSIISIMKHPLSHMIYPVLLYKLRKSLKVSFKEFLYIEHLTNNVFSENYQEYKIMFHFNKDLKNLLFNAKLWAFFHINKWISWFMLITLGLYLLVYIFGFPVYFISLLIVYLYIYFKSEFFVELNLLWIKYYLWIIITLVFILNWWLDTTKWEKWITQWYAQITSINWDDVLLKSVNNSSKLVVEWIKHTNQFVADILKK